MRKLPTLSAVLLGSLLAGCASTINTCEDPNSGCASLEDTYQAALQDDGRAENVNLLQRGRQTAQVADARPHDGESLFRTDFAAEPRGTPIYSPPVPHKLWVAPWRDANNVLHGGEYVYYLTPGYFTTGTLTAPGQGAEVLGPLKPEDLGFTPRFKVDPSTAGTSAEQAQPAGAVQPEQQLLHLPARVQGGK